MICRISESPAFTPLRIHMACIVELEKEQCYFWSIWILSVTEVRKRERERAITMPRHGDAFERSKKNFVNMLSTRTKKERFVFY